MKASELLGKLTAIIAEHGDLPVCCEREGFNPEPTVTLLDESGIVCGTFGAGKPAEIFIE